jgi:hypothetical protein
MEKIKQKTGDQIVKIKSNNELNSIKDWIDQLDHGPYFAIAVDTIHCYITSELNEENRWLIGYYLSIIIKNNTRLSNDEILLFGHLKNYIKTNDVNAKIELEKFNSELTSTSNNSEVLQKISSIFSISKISKLIPPAFFKPQSNISLENDKLFPDAQLNLQTNSELAVPPEKSINISRRKKNKPRIINFDDEDGVGYDEDSFYLYSKEVNRLNKINLEIESPRKKKSWEEELQRLGKIEIDPEEDSFRLDRKIEAMEFELFASTEEKEAKKKSKNLRQYRDYLKITQQKISQNKKISKLLIPVIVFILKKIDSYKQKGVKRYLVDLQLDSIEIKPNKFLNAFFETINYERFLELLDYSESILTSINKVKKTLNKIDHFAKCLGCSVNYVSSLDDLYKKIKETFSIDNIGNLLESSLNLFEKRISVSDTNYCLLKTDEQEEIEFDEEESDYCLLKTIEFLEPVSLDELIAQNKPEKISNWLRNYLKEYFDQDVEFTLIRNKSFEEKTGLIKKIFNYFLGKHYFSNKSHQEKFVKKFLLYDQDNLTFEAIKTKISNLKFWNFIFFGISPIHLFKKNFREQLSEKLFLNFLNEELKTIDEKPSIENIDALFSIKNRINFPNIGIQSKSVNLSPIESLESRQEIIDQFNKHEAIRYLSEKISILSFYADRCINKFSNMESACHREAEKIPSSFNLAKKYFFQNVMRNSFNTDNNINNFSLSF